MKKVILLMVVLILSLSGCKRAVTFGNIDNVKITAVSSEVYSEQDIKSAIIVVTEHFRKNFSDCVLNEISYAGDDKIERELSMLLEYKANDVIVLTSCFEAGVYADPSFYPDDVYEDWNWTLVRKKGENWQLVNFGYC